MWQPLEKIQGIRDKNATAQAPRVSAPINSTSALPACKSAAETLAIVEYDPSNANSRAVSRVEAYQTSITETQAQLKKLQVGHRVGLIDQILQYATRAEFCGHTIRGRDGARQRLDLPKWVVPMCAEFNDLYASDFTTALTEALEYVRDSSKLDFHQGPNHREQAEHMILIPIKSPGGDIDVLKPILSYINTIKADVVPAEDDNGQSDPKRRIKIVTYGFGRVASCAFILYQTGDICLADENAQFMCHEPAFSRKIGPSQDMQIQSTNCAASDRRAHQLKELKRMLYSEAERCLYERTRTNKTETLIAWRNRWKTKHYRDGSIVALIQKIRDRPAERPPEYETKKMDVFDYLMTECAMNPEDQWLESVDMFELDLLEAVSPSVHLTTMEGISVQEAPSFASRLTA